MAGEVQPRRRLLQHGRGCRRKSDYHDEADRDGVALQAEFFIGDKITVQRDGTKWRQVPKEPNEDQLNQ